KGLIIFLYAIIGFTFVTAVVAILQFFNISFFWHMREALGVPKSLMPLIRVSGLSSYVVPLSYQLLSALPLLIVFSIVKIKLFLPKKIIVIITATILVALLVTFMRAAVLGVFIGGLIVFIFLLRLKLYTRFSIIFFASLLLLSLPIVISQEKIYQGIFRLGDTVSERIPTTVAALNIVAMNPFGVGSMYSDRVKDIYYSDIEYYPRAAQALVLFPHNILLNVGVLFGWTAIALVIIFYSQLFKLLYRNTKRDDKVLQAVSIGLIGSFSAYLINAMFHNASPFIGDPFNWFYLGSAFLVIILSQEKYVQPSSRQRNNERLHLSECISLPRKTNPGLHLASMDTVSPSLFKQG
ncbi:MAG: O-antigen ligase family protein, partial [Planctomycetes bacterium]|nr:O-antigen ligase family protein [Planctomycetota bacterium]